MQKKAAKTPWYKQTNVIIFAVVAVALGVYAMQSGLFTPATPNVNEVSQAFVSQPATVVNTWKFDSNAAVAQSGWKLYGYQGIVPYGENSMMVVPGPITSSTGLWTNKLNIPVANFDKQGLLVEITLAATSQDTSVSSVPFTMVAGLSQETTLTGTAFAAAETDAVVSPDLTTYTFLFTPNQFEGVTAVKALTIGLNTTGADVASLIVKDITIKTLD